jgi:hypothetical protein
VRWPERPREREDRRTLTLVIVLALTLRPAPMLLMSELLYAACLGIALLTAFKRLPGGPAGWLLWALIGWVFGFHLLVGEAEPRYHFPLLPALLALGAVGMRAAWKRFVPPRARGQTAVPA